MRHSVGAVGTLLMILSGCATTINKPSGLLGSDASKVVFIRKCAEPTAWNVQIKIDGKQLASVANDSQATLDVPSGKHKYQIDWPFLAAQNSLSGEFDFPENKTTYFMYESNYVFGGSYLPGTISYTATAKLHVLDEKVAEEVLSALKGKTGWGCR